MGTRSTVKFIDGKENVVLSIYGQYDGYVAEGGTAHLLGWTLNRWVVEGVEEVHFNGYLNKEIRNVRQANGIDDLALLYVMDNKRGAYNMYVGADDGVEEFNYTVTYIEQFGYMVKVEQESWLDIEGMNDSFIGGTYTKLLFEGTLEEYLEYLLIEGIDYKKNPHGEEEQV